MDLGSIQVEFRLQNLKYNFSLPCWGDRYAPGADTRFVLKDAI